MKASTENEWHKHEQQLLPDGAMYMKHYPSFEYYLVN